MSFFRKRLRREPEAAPGDRPDRTAIRAWAIRLPAGGSSEWNSGDAGAFREYLASEPDPERRDFTIEAVLRGTNHHGAWVDAWVAEEPESALAHMVRGRQLVGWAWDARSFHRAKFVKEEQFNQFFARLDLAWRSFSRSIELDPEEASTYSLMLDCAKGLEVDPQVEMDLYRAAQGRRPWEQIAHQSMIQCLAKSGAATKRRCSSSRTPRRHRSRQDPPSTPS